ncbi:eukaryotic translation initiation factor 4 gamma-like isoform X2 [Biomphalaria pfeifferi]|uniref:Eukaryotic translation initiation factor 4 gamma-like isoform X2 n=1 Tax=Biomphalaria pfeifferi TaxID=112525 RepID=A0AAD8FEY1_BIOPF|nr:eukaryotic translation initiation factor 4 gamma-like isoform X2 [Biomphalaria pfeifferi]
MSLRVIKRTRNPFETLEKMLNKTTLVTQRVTHNHIIDIGDKILEANCHGDNEGRENAILEAIESAEARATRELREALRRLKQQKDEERLRALEKQKWYFERLAARISDQRDRAEEEKMKEFKRKMEVEKEEALKKQLEECERLKQIAVEEAREAISKQLRNEFAIRKEMEIAAALKKAREAFRKREAEVIEQTRRECEEEARKEAQRIATLHKTEIDSLNHKYDMLEQKFQREIAHRKKVEHDFRALQDDYRRFMDYTDGKFHSDYLMQLRYLGLQLADKKLQVVTYKDIEPIK